MLGEKIRERIPEFLKNLYRFIIIIFRYPLARFRALPDFLIIGVHLHLFEYLKQYPNIKTPVFKKVHYYDFSKKSKHILYGEASPYYFFHLVPERVFKDNPNIKLILLLRDPIERAYSPYQMERRKGREKIKSFEEAISVEAERIQEGYNAIVTGKESYNYKHHIYDYLARGCYDEKLKHWLKYFKKKQLMVLKSEGFFYIASKGILNKYISS
jgi:hypothetical protein